MESIHYEGIYEGPNGEICTMVINDGCWRCPCKSLAVGKYCTKEEQKFAIEYVKMTNRAW